MDWTVWLEWAIKGLGLIFTLLIGFGYLTYYERRFLARLQSRLGPNRPGPYGLMQWMADSVKLIFLGRINPCECLQAGVFPGTRYYDGAVDRDRSRYPLGAECEFVRTGYFTVYREH